MGRDARTCRSHAGDPRADRGFGDLADVAAAHHERLDGTGYPLALPAAAISRDTRIITACDFYDALVSERPYRAALPVEEALADHDRGKSAARSIRNASAVLKSTVAA